MHLLLRPPRNTAKGLVLAQNQPRPLMRSHGENGLLERKIPRDWYCLQIHRNADAVVESNIKRLGITYFNPSIPDTSKPLFPGYLFCAFNKYVEPQWRTLWYIPGAKRILSTSAENPTPVPTRLILAMQGLFPPPEDITCIDDYDLTPGLYAEIVSGPFAGLLGVTKIAEKDRITLLLTMLGSEREITFNKRDLRPYAAP